MTTNDEILTKIVSEYSPYDRFDTFGEGFIAHQSRNYRNPYDGPPAQGVAAQAWDRGLEAASRYGRALAGLPY